MQIDTSKITISKTTVNGLLSAAVTVLVAISALPPHTRVIAYLIAVARAVSGYLQVDAK